MNRTSLALLAALLLGTIGAGVVAWRHMGDLQGQVAELRGSVATLGSELRAAEERAQQADARAADSETRAGRAAELAERLAARAQAAEEAASTAEQEAAAQRERAAVAAGEAVQARQAEEAAETQKREMMERAEQAFLEAERAKREAAELRRRREQELDRLARALDQIADTRRTALGMVMNLGDSIEFDFDKADLRPANREILARIAGVLMTAEDFGIQVYGHTDDVGNADYNQKLSERRARAVREYLVASGVRPEVITSTGMGKAVPLVKGTDADARQRNRRVEIAVVHSAGEPVAVLEPPGDR
jgi:outer membrane protein OmpA-like peptidoglycan-associated protein